MYTEKSIMLLWNKVLTQFKVDFPQYALLLKDKKWSAGVRTRKNKSFGWASPVEKKVIINLHLHKNSTESMIVDTMLHEIAHAVDFCKRGTSDHSSPWKKIAAEIGAMPKSVSKSALRVEYPYVCVYKESEISYHFVKGYNRRPSRQKVNAVMQGVYLTSKPESENRIFLYDWKVWCNICKTLNTSPYKEER